MHYTKHILAVIPIHRPRRHQYSTTHSHSSSDHDPNPTSRPHYRSATIHILADRESQLLRCDPGPVLDITKATLPSGSLGGTSRQMNRTTPATLRDSWQSGALIEADDLELPLGTFLREEKWAEVNAWSHGTGLIITSQLSHRFSHMSCTSCTITMLHTHPHSALYYTQTCSTSDDGLSQKVGRCILTALRDPR